MYKKLFSHTLIYGLSPYVPKILGLFILPIITADLTEQDYGVYGIILAYVGGIEVLKDLGLNLMLYNSFTKMPQQYKWLWRSIYGFLTLWNGIYAIFAALLIYIAVPEEAVENRWKIMLLNLAPIILFGPTALIGRVYYQMKEKPMQIAWRTVLFGILTILLNLYSISYLKMGYMGWFWSNCISGILTNLSFWFPLNFKYNLKPIFNFKRRLIRNNLKVSLPTVPHYYSNYIIQSSDKVILDTLNVNAQAIGGYNFAGMFGGYFSQLGMALGQAARPIFNVSYKNKDYATVREVIFNLQLLTFCLTFLCSIWLKEIFQLLVKNEGLLNVYPMALVLIMATSYRPMYMGAINVLIYNEKTKKLMRVTLIGSIICVLLNLGLIPSFGVWAAVLSTYISMMYLGYSGYFLKEFKETKTNFYPLYWLSATVALTIIAYFYVELNLIYKVIATILVIILTLLYAFRLYKKKKFN